MGWHKLRNCYKPVETKVDSAFAPYDDPVFFEELSELLETTAEYKALEEKAKQMLKLKSWN